MTLRILSLAVAGLLCAACGSTENASPGSGASSHTAAPGATATQAASAPASGSRLVFSFQGNDEKPIRVDVSGAALARQLNDGRLMIYVYSNDIAATPTCDAINPSERQGWKGAQIGLVIYDFPNKAGKIKAKEALIEYHEPTGAPASMDDLHGPDIDIEAYDGKTLRAKVVTPDPPEVKIARVDGTVLATVCPPQK